MENAELHVLWDARQTILGRRPLILYESFPRGWISVAGEKPGDIADFLRESSFLVTNCELDEILALPKQSVRMTWAPIRSVSQRCESSISL